MDNNISDVTRMGTSRGIKKTRLSYSALESLQVCERKFQLDRLLEGAPEKQDYPATIFGKAFGVGISSYLLTQDPDKAIKEAWEAYFPVLEDEKRTEEKMIFSLLNMFQKLDNVLEEWTVASFNFKPAIELSFCIHIDEDYYYVGYIDVVLKSRFTDRYAILEVKTTGLSLEDITPLYRNSGQALGYSIVLDAIAGEEHTDYDVIYCVSQDKSITSWNILPHVFNFAKNLRDRFHWFISLGMDVQRLHSMKDTKIYPIRGGACLQYRRPCFHFGTCNLTSLDRDKEIKEDLIEYDFVFELEDLIEKHISRINN